MVTLDGQRLTYGGMAATIESFAAHIGDRVRPGDHVCIEIPTSAIIICMAMALSRLGAVPVLGVSSREARECGIDIDAAITINVAVEPGVRLLVFSQSWMSWPEGYTPGVSREPVLNDDEPMVIMSSSGSTGRRKFMAYSGLNLKTRFPNYDSFLGAFGRRLVCVSSTSVIGFSAIMRSLAIGGMVAEPFVEDANTLKLIDDHGIEEIVASPLAIERLITAQERAGASLRSLQQILAAGASLSPELAKRAHGALCENIRIGYGTSEAGFMACINANDNPHPMGVGYLAPWASVDALDEEGHALGVGETGLIRIKVDPDFSVDGYIGAEEPAGSDLKNGVFVPGDIGSVREDGLLVISGRAGDVINLGGDKISVGLIESEVGKIEGVSSVAAMGVATDLGFQKLLVVIEADHESSKLAARKLILKLVGDFVEFQLERVEKLPVTPTQKPDRQQLIQMFCK